MMDTFTREQFIEAYCFYNPACTKRRAERVYDIFRGTSERADGELAGWVRAYAERQAAREGGGSGE